MYMNCRAGQSQYIVRLVLAVANNLTIKISRGEVFEHVQKTDAVIENCRKCTINRKALRLVAQLVTISKNQSWGITMCVGWFPDHVCWDVRMQFSQCLDTQYGLPCTEWLRGRPFGLLGGGIVFLSSLTLTRYPAH